MCSTAGSCALLVLTAACTFVSAAWTFTRHSCRTHPSVFSHLRSRAQVFALFVYIGGDLLLRTGTFAAFLVAAFGTEQADSGTDVAIGVVGVCVAIVLQLFARHGAARRAPAEPRLARVKTALLGAFVTDAPLRYLSTGATTAPEKSLEDDTEAAVELSVPANAALVQAKIVGVVRPDTALDSGTAQAKLVASSLQALFFSASAVLLAGPFRGDNNASQGVSSSTVDVVLPSAVAVLLALKLALFYLPHWGWLAACVGDKDALEAAARFLTDSLQVLIVLFSFAGWLNIVTASNNVDTGTANAVLITLVVVTALQVSLALWRGIAMLSCGRRKSSAEGGVRKGAVTCGTRTSAASVRSRGAFRDLPLATALICRVITTWVSANPVLLQPPTPQPTPPPTPQPALPPTPQPTQAPPPGPALCDATCNTTQAVRTPLIAAILDAASAHLDLVTESSDAFVLIALIVALLSAAMTITHATYASPLNMWYGCPTEVERRNPTQRAVGAMAQRVSSSVTFWPTLACAHSVLEPSRLRRRTGSGDTLFLLAVYLIFIITAVHRMRVFTRMHVAPESCRGCALRRCCSSPLKRR